MAEYLEGLTLEYRQSADPEVWFDISTYLVTDIDGEYGLGGESPTDRVATTGYINFSLNNVDNIFAPNLSTALVGWGKGTKVRVTATFDGEQWVKFYGSIDTLDIDTKDYGERRVAVSCVDWMNNASTYPLKQTTILTDKTADQAIKAIVDLMPTPPLDTQYNTGIDTFPTVFDTTKPTAKAVTEFQKLMMSELAYVYLRRSRLLGEQLVVESRATRNTSELGLLPVSISRSGNKMLMQGGHMKLMDGGYKLLHQTSFFAFDNNMKDVQVVNGEYVMNDVTVKVYPRKVDAVISVLFTLQNPMAIGAGETITIRGTYRDNYGVAVNGCGYTNKATNIACTMSAGGVVSIDEASVIPGSEAFSVPITNTGTACTINTFTFSLKAIHVEPLESNVMDAVSIENYDYHSTILDQSYQDSLDAGMGLAWVAVYKGALPHTVAKKIFLLANQDYNSMSAFLNMDIGVLIKVVEDRSEINSSYYIVRVGFKITLGGIIDYWFEVQEALSFSSVFWQVGTAGRTEVGNLIVGT